MKSYIMTTDATPGDALWSEAQDKLSRADPRADVKQYQYIGVALHPLTTGQHVTVGTADDDGIDVLARGRITAIVIDGVDYPVDHDRAATMIRHLALYSDFKKCYPSPEVVDAFARAAVGLPRNNKT